MPVGLSWTLVAAAFASLLWWMTGVSALHRIKVATNESWSEWDRAWLNGSTCGRTKTLTDSMAAQWLQAVRSGLTEAEAQRWSDHGFSYTVAAAALQAKVSLPEVEAIAAEVRRGGGIAVDRRWAMADVLTTSGWPGWYSWRSWSILFNDPTVALRGWGHIPLHGLPEAVPALANYPTVPRTDFGVGGAAA